MWRKIFRPEVIFLLGTLQALLPYVLAAIGATPPEVNSLLSDYPLFIWIIGYACFWIGTRLAPRDIPDGVSPPVAVSMSILKGSLVILILAGLVEMYGLIRLYGGIPLLAFASGQLDVNDTNSIQTQSGFGQVGLAALTVFLLIGVVCLIAIKARQENLRVARWTLSALLFTLFMSAFNGKRQGILMCVAILVSCSVIAFGSPFALVRGFFPLKLKKRGTVVLSILLALVVLKAISGLASLRTSGDVTRSATAELALYYEWPILNMSVQSRDAQGFGPSEFKPLGPFQTLLPAKLSFLDDSVFGTEPPRFEISSPSGFYERLQWDLGLWGIIPFSLLCGVFTQWMYHRAFRSHAALLTYGFMAWALFSAALYNHFLNLLFLPLPALIFFAASYVNREMRRAFRYSNGITARPSNSEVM
ncbi:MAG TPA: O-antigen polymerase [Acidobacteriaceae bacterium]|nr:O-antigen polymerase [Acidobacteriaceae bacterium]